jgi:hypothetical protein
MEFKDVRDLVCREKRYKEFPKLAEVRMGNHFGVSLTERRIPGFPKKWDLVSEDHTIIGDAKWLSLVNGVSPPPAKLMEITSHVWLLEQTKAQIRFLVFGNQQEVPELWLKKYGHLKRSVDFYFLDADRPLVHLK